MFKEGNEANTLTLCACIVLIALMTLAFIENYGKIYVEIEAIKAGLVQTVEQGKIIWVFKAQ